MYIIIQCACMYMSCCLLVHTYRGESGRAHQLTTLIGNETIGVEPNSDYITFLGSSELVSGAFLISNGDCSLTSRLQVNISSLDSFRKRIAMNIRITHVYIYIYTYTILYYIVISYLYRNVENLLLYA